MADTDRIFDNPGLCDRCDGDGPGNSAPMSMAGLIGRSGGGAPERSLRDTPFPSMDPLNDACAEFPQSREVTQGIERGFLHIEDALSTVIDPPMQPPSRALQNALRLFRETPWRIVIPAPAFVDHYDDATQTLAIIFVRAAICVPFGISMSRSDRFRNSMIPVLDMLRTLLPFACLIPLIFLFLVTGPKLYGIVPVVPLTDPGIRLVDKEVIEAADAFGMTRRQKLCGVQIPLIRTDLQDLRLERQRELQKTAVFIIQVLDEALKPADHLPILRDGEV